MTERFARHARGRGARALRKAAILLCAVTAASTTAHADEVYVLRPHAVVTSNVVRLGDIVDGPVAERPTAKTPSATPLWRAPPACRPMTAAVGDVVSRLRQLNAMPPDVSFAGSGEVRIEASCQRVDSALLVAVAAQELDRWLRVRSDRFDLAVRGTLEALELPPGHVSVTAREVAPGQTPAAHMQVWVDVAVADRFIRAIPLVFDVHAFRSAWVAMHELHAGQPLAGAALVQREIDVAPLPAEPVRAIPGNVRLRRALLAGEALTASHMEPRPQVAQGSTVVVTSRAGAFAVEARAEALQDGRIGQPVWVRVPASTGPVLARVVDENMVELNHE